LEMSVGCPVEMFWLDSISLPQVSGKARSNGTYRPLDHRSRERNPAPRMDAGSL